MEESKELRDGLLEVIYCGDHELFNRIADVLRDPDKYLVMPSHTSRAFKVFDAVTTAATAAGRPPTREEVGKVLAEITGPLLGDKLFPTAHESDELQKLLDKSGFGWLAHGKRGEHLKKRKSP